MVKSVEKGSRKSGALPVGANAGAGKDVKRRKGGDHPPASTGNRERGVGRGERWTFMLIVTK
jgi:hypothetical protein